MAQDIDLDSSEFLDRLRAGDDDAAEALVRHTSGPLLAVARRMLMNDDDAADAIQETYLSAFRRIADFHGDSKLTTWIHRIAINACLMKLRTRRRRPAVSLDSLAINFAEDGHMSTRVTAWKDQAHSLDQSESAALVRRLIEELPDDFRTVLILRDIEGLQTADVASALDISEAAVKTRLHRARLALRMLLDPHLRKEDE